MPVVWKVKGEAAKAWDETEVPLADFADGATVEFRALDVDALTLRFTADDLADLVLPEIGQKLSLLRDSTQFFAGHVIGDPVTDDESGRFAEVVVAGPWWWMEQIPLTQDQADGAGDDAERVSFIFGTDDTGGNLKAHIEAVIARSIALGVPMQAGTVADFFAVPRITLTQSSCAQVLSELIRLVPDAMVWFDYGTSPPTIHVTRRGVATTRTLDAGGANLSSIRIGPALELQVSQVRLPYVERDAQGRTVYSEQSSGTPAVGRVEILTISGPELDTFLPNDLLDTYTIRTVAPTGSPLAAFAISADRQLAAVRAKYNLATLPITAPSSFQQWSGWRFSPGCGVENNSPSILYQPPAPQFLDDLNQPVSALGKYVVATANVPDWVLEENLTQFTKVRLVMNLLHVHFTQDPGCSFGSAGPVIPLPVWHAEVTWDSDLLAFPYRSGGRFSVYIHRTEIECWLSTTEYSSETPIYRAADYTFIAPPAGLAANLKAAQDWLPYKGRIEMMDEECGTTRYRGCKVNIANSMAAHASMGALVSIETLDIMNGITAIELGQPPRLSFRSFVDAIRRTPTDNIVYL